ncbi:hypothetical protein ACQEU6_40690 [Spirillospora sp. CA-108201]
MDSLTAAGWKFPGRPEAADESSTDPTGDKQESLEDRSAEAKSDAKKEPEADATDGGSQSTEEPDDTAEPAETGNGDPETEEAGQAKTENPPQDEGERANENRVPGLGRPEAGGAEGQDDRGSSADDKTDDPEPPQPQEPFPTDDAAPPKPPSRLESLARAREVQFRDAEQLRAKFQEAQIADGDRRAPSQSENVGGDEREPEKQLAATEASPGDSGEPPAAPVADAPRPAGVRAPVEGYKAQPGPEAGQPAENAVSPSGETGENAATPEVQGDQDGEGGESAVADGTREGAEDEATTIEAVEAETTELPSGIIEELVDGEAAGKPTRLEGQRDYVVDDPAVPGRTITDIDRIQGGVLWEEKSATHASDVGRWVAKHIDKKFSSYLDARQYIVGYEQAPIGFHFTSPGADPVFRSEVESAVERLRQAYPTEQILLEWS